MAFCFDPHLSFTMGESLLNCSTPPSEMRYHVDLFLNEQCDSKLLTDKIKLSYAWCEDGAICGHIYIFINITTETENISDMQ